MNIKIWIMLFLSTVASVSLHAGVVMISDQTMTIHGQSNTMASQGKMYADQGKSRVDMTGGMLSGHTMIYRKDKGVMWFIDTQKNTYTETTLAELQKVSEKVSPEMETKLKAIREKMAAKGIKLPTSPETSTKPLFQKVASGEKVESWICDRYEGTTNGKKTHDIWVTPPSAVGLSDGDYQVMKDLASSMKTSSASSSMGSLFGEDGVNGIPVKFVYYSASGQTVTNQVREVSHQETPGSLFELPAGVRKMEVPNAHIDDR